MVPAEAGLVTKIAAGTTFDLPVEARCLAFLAVPNG